MPQLWTAAGSYERVSGICRPAGRSMERLRLLVPLDPGHEETPAAPPEDDVPPRSRALSFPCTASFLDGCGMRQAGKIPTAVTPGEWKGYPIPFSPQSTGASAAPQTGFHTSGQPLSALDDMELGTGLGGGLETLPAHIASVPPDGLSRFYERKAKRETPWATRCLGGGLANVIKLRKSSKLWAAIKFWYRFELLENPNFFIG